LLLQRLSEIVRALPQLLEQAGILDGDHGLIREGLDERKLLVGEGSNLAPHIAIAPMRTPSRRIGTPRRVRTRPVPGAWTLTVRQSASACASRICIVRSSTATRPTTEPSPGRISRRGAHFRKPAGAL